MNTKLKRFFAGFGIAPLVLTPGYSLLRLVHLRSGASDADLMRPMPGDLSGSRWTRAVLDGVISASDGHATIYKFLDGWALGCGRRWVARWGYHCARSHLAAVSA